MSELHFPWLEFAIFLPLLGSLVTSIAKGSPHCRATAIVFAGLSLMASVGAWLDLGLIHQFQAVDRYDLGRMITGRSFFVIDELSGPLLPLSAFMVLLIVATTQSTKTKRFSYASTLLSAAILLATLSCKHSWGIVFFLAAGVLPPLMELKRRGKPTFVFASHMVAFVALLVLGMMLVDFYGQSSKVSFWVVLPLLVAVLIRCGIAPVHCWMTDLFEHASLGGALLFVCPMIGEYATIRLILPIAPDWALRWLGILSLITTIYAAGMSLIQLESRRFFCYLFLSHTSLVLVGLESLTPLGLAGGLCVWLSSSLSLVGLGLTFRAIEARDGRLSLDVYHGLYDRVPHLAAMFLVMALASVGFPGTFGFVGTEILIDGAIQRFPHIGVAVVIALALNGIGVVKVYLRIFTGRRVTTGISLQGHWSEYIGLVALALLIIGGGIFPQPGIESRYHAAREIFREMSSKSGLEVDHLHHENPEDAHNQTMHETSDNQWPHVETFSDKPEATAQESKNGESTSLEKLQAETSSSGSKVESEHPK
jgi:NADH-quinone oxidoreductase subunit M